MRSHPRLFVVRFEDMVSTPQKAMQSIYDFLGLSFGLSQLQWLDSHFWHGNGNWNNCSGGDWDKFSTCREHPMEVALKWRHELTVEEKKYFNSNILCRGVRDKFHYPRQ